MNEHRDDLSTADLAGQQPAETAGPERVREDDIERHDVDTYQSGDRETASGDWPRDATGSGDRDGDLERGSDRSRHDDRSVAAGSTDQATLDSAPGPVGSSTVYPTPDAGASTPGTGSTVGAGPGAGAPAPVGTSTGDLTPGAGAPAPFGTSTPDTGAAGSAPTTGPLLPGAEAEGFRARWTDVQTGFVDSPRQAVQQADGLTAELMQHLAKTFADERRELERQWDRGDDVATDELRTAFQRYRSFFERLLAT